MCWIVEERDHVGTLLSVRVMHQEYASAEEMLDAVTCLADAFITAAIYIPTEMSNNTNCTPSDMTNDNNKTDTWNKTCNWTTDEGHLVVTKISEETSQLLPPILSSGWASFFHKHPVETVVRAFKWYPALHMSTNNAGKVLESGPTMTASEHLASKKWAGGFFGKTLG